MRTRVDEKLRAEARRFRFRFACEDCVHADRASHSLRCSLGYPAAPRLDVLDPREGETDFESCKSFELGP